jgi:hypothetical protein
MMQVTAVLQIGVSLRTGGVHLRTLRAVDNCRFRSRPYTLHTAGAAAWAQRTKEYV